MCVCVCYVATFFNTRKLNVPRMIEWVRHRVLSFGWTEVLQCVLDSPLLRGIYLRKKRITVGRMVEWCKVPKLKHTW